MVPCEPVPWPADAHPGWAALGFAPAGMQRFSYETQVSPDGRTIVIRALGDLDCDGVPEIVERRGHASGDSLAVERAADDVPRSGTHPHGFDWD
jgi:hypothetical protein